MKVEKKVEKNECVVSLTIQADADEIRADYKKVLNTFVREGRIPGFRPGKAPLEVVMRKFSSEIQQEAQSACFRSLYPKAVEEAKIDPLAVEGVTESVFSPETGITFTVLVEVRPEYKLPKYKGLSIKHGDATVKDEDVTARVEQIRTQFATYEDAAEGTAAAEGDFVQFDYSGTLDGKPLAEIVADKPAICEAKGFWVQLEEGQFLPEVLDALKGMKPGEEAEVKVKFAKEDATPEPLRGKKCLYQIKLLALRSRKLPDDEAFAKAAQTESFEKIRANVRETMEKQATEAELNSRRDQAVELLLKKADFDVPPMLVQRQADAFLNRFAQQMQMAGVTADYIKENRESILKNATDAATRQVRLSYILADIAEEEKIEVDEKDEQKREQLRAEKTLDFILAQAK